MLCGEAQREDPFDGQTEGGVLEKQWKEENGGLPSGYVNIVNWKMVMFPGNLTNNQWKITVF